MSSSTTVSPSSSGQGGSSAAAAPGKGGKSGGGSGGSRIKSLLLKLGGGGQSSKHAKTSPTRASPAPNTSHAQPAAQSGSVSSRKSGRGPATVATNAAGHNATGNVPVLAAVTRPADGLPVGAMTEHEPPARNGATKSIQDTANAPGTSAHIDGMDENGSDGEGDDSGELDGADRDASIRPLTPSTIDAASSFTGSRSTSLHSLAPTSRTFKSFVTGHSKTSASTKPTTLMTTHQTSPPASQHQQQQQGVAPEASHTATASKSVADVAQSEGLGLADMHAASSNRLATSVHEADGVVQPVNHLPVASTSSPTQPDSLPAPARPAQLAKASPLRNSFLGAVPASSSSSAHSTPTEEAAPPAPVRMLSSSNSITFSSLPSPSHRLASPTQAGDADQMDEDPGNVESSTHYPSHHVPDPRNNPRASSPPPDNASTLTLASSTAPSLRGTANGSIRQAAVPSILGVSRDGRRHSGGNYAANEDASIRAIAPSRRESTDSIGSKWSAAVLSNRDKATDRENSFHTGRETSAGDTGSHARKTPSMHTVNTTASSYYFAAPVSQPV